MMVTRQHRLIQLIRLVSGLALAFGMITFTQDSATAQGIVDRTRLPIGDGKVSRSAQVGYLWSCMTNFSDRAGAFRDGPWIKSDGTFDFTQKAVVDGAVEWPNHTFSITLQGDKRVLTGNDLPDHTTGVFPIARNDDAFLYDRNPNRIRLQQLSYSLPANPVLAAQPSCMGGEVGVLLTGAMLFNAVDAGGRDAVAHETQDSCQGHPQPQGVYHYHNLTDCLADAETGHSPLMGYAFDGFGIYGIHGENGEVLGSADLDECHGHTHEIEWDGKKVVMYHYHATYDYPYTVGCYRGSEPVRQRPPR